MSLPTVPIVLATLPSRKRIAGALVALVLVLMVGLVALPSSSAAAPPDPAAKAKNGGDPPGNNGVIKVDRREFDDHPNNEPHVGCEFEIDFYNYDKGDLHATYTFELQPPTGGGTLKSGRVFIGEDPAGGGRDVDAKVTVNLKSALQASGVSPHPKQGYHVKLTVHAEGSIGADTKHKVFWVQGCTPSSASTPTPTPTPTRAPQVVNTPTPTPTSTRGPAVVNTPTPTATPVPPTPTNTPRPPRRREPTNTPVPQVVEEPTSTPAPRDEDSETPTPVSEANPIAGEPDPTATPVPPTATPTRVTQVAPIAGPAATATRAPAPTATRVTRAAPVAGRPAATPVPRVVQPAALPRSGEGGGAGSGPQILLTVLGLMGLAVLVLRRPGAR